MASRKKMIEAMKANEMAVQASLRTTRKNVKAVNKLLDAHDARQYVRIERYDFSITSDYFTLGAPIDGCLKPMCQRISSGYIHLFRPHGIMFNAPCPHFAYLDEIYFGYECVWTAPTAQGVDTYDFSPLSHRRTLILRQFTSFEDVTFLVRYTGLVPKLFKRGQKYIFCASLQGGVQTTLEFSHETDPDLPSLKPSRFARVEERIGV